MLLSVLLSVAAVLFVAGNAARLIRFLRMPTPLRWELYPIPKGPRARQQYGGSYFEETSWWDKPQASDHTGEFTFMLREVLYLKSVREGFRGLWIWSLLLHWGLYLYVAASACAGAAALTRSEALCSVSAYAYSSGCFSGFAGALGILAMRVFHPRLRRLSARVSFFDLLLLAAIFATGIAALLTGASASGAPVGSHRSSAAYVHGLLVALFLAYFPFTHMTHAYMKFFTWHRVRWNDTPTIYEAATAAATGRNLQRRTSWAAPHIAGGERTWSEVVAETGLPEAERRA